MKNLLALFLSAVFLGCQSGEHIQNETYKEDVSPLYDKTLKPFYHGVASGDPLSDRVIIWTRVTPETVVDLIPVQWEISESDDFKTIVRSDTTSARASKDYTVKIDVTGLNENSYYFYRFHALDKTSMVGRTKTLPIQNIDSVRLAVASCSNWEFGYFNAYAAIAAREVDAVIHLGDYIYEYATGVYANKNSGRKNLPAHEIVTLTDYRTRYSQYHLDNGLRQMRQRHPLIAIWDDHEFANDVYKSGAQNHQAEEGDFHQRKAAATQAYYEWIPIREGERLYRAFNFGNLVKLIMLDERVEGRVKPLERADDPALEKEYRSMLGEAQLGWLLEELRAANQWKVIGNQVLFSALKRPGQKIGINLDSWAGYPLEKRAISDFIQTNHVKNTIFITGDTHASWAFEVSADPFGKKVNPFAVEFGTTSISSGNANESKSDDSVRMQEQAYLNENPHLKFTNLRDHGYLLLTLSRDSGSSAWYYVNQLLKEDAEETMARTVIFRNGSSMLK